MKNIIRQGALVIAALLAFTAILTPDAAAQPQGRAWAERYAWAPLPWGAAAADPAPPARLPVLRLPEGGGGPRIVRVSVPFAPGALPQGRGLTVHTGDGQVSADVRVLTTHPEPGRSARRALVTFPWNPPAVPRGVFSATVALSLADGPVLPDPALADGPFAGTLGEFGLEVDAAGVRLLKGGGPWITAVPLAPEPTEATPPVTEVVERGRHFLWVRVFFPDAAWPRIVEARLDAQGRAALRLHVQRVAPDDGRAPDLGWRVAGPGAPDGAMTHDFSSGGAFPAVPALPLGFPDAAFLGRGSVEILPADGAGFEAVYLRCRAAEQVPMQGMSWRTAAVAVGHDPAAWTDQLEPGPEGIAAAPEAFDAVYACGVSPVLPPDFEAARRFHQNAMADASILGDDFGSVGAMPASGMFSMNRLNHCPAIFEEAYRSGDTRLRRTALRWCANFHDLTVWWGDLPEGHFGGTRYNNAVANGDKTHEGDQAFMWRSNDAVHFCTKGYDSFLYAWEETGDPRMAAALRHQTAYAEKMIHTDQGECRNIGDALDFLRLHRFTGHGPWLEAALRLFRELRTKLGDDHLFSQGGQPIEADPPFIDDDAMGSKHPFGKPYIMGYALQGLPALSERFPDEPRLGETVSAVAAFLARAQDPTGGWRYPHPRSSSLFLSQSVEHAAQMVRAAAVMERRDADITPLLDAVERTLRARVLGLHKTGAFLGGVTGWEKTTGALKEGQTLHDLYAKPADRDPARDHTEGAVSAGAAPPEGAVHFSEVLDFYAARRDPARLLEAGPELAAVLARAPEIAPWAEAAPKDFRRAPETAVRGFGVEDGLPVFFRERLAELRTFPMALTPEEAAVPERLDAWRKRGREKVLACLGTPPPAPAAFDPVTVAEEDRGAYTARRVIFSVSAWERAPALLLTPRGAGPFPAVLALHDHGAHFSIGKEKVVRPLAGDKAFLADAEDWARQCYGGRFFGDELAKRGYVVLAVDALYWGERGRREGVSYEDQQQLAANLQQLGMTWPGVIAWDDLRSADFLASLPEVDPARIGAMGLSMGAHRTWTTCALTDRIRAGAAVCWMGDTQTLMQPGNNQTRGQSAYSMAPPLLRAWMDYADVASLACPKPMLFFNGEQDTLFPVDGVRAAYGGLERAWAGAGAGDRLVTQLWDVPHQFSVEMQEEAFAWLEKQLAGG